MDNEYEDIGNFIISFSTNFVKKILLVEDNIGDVVLFKDLISQIKNYNIILTHAETMYDAYRYIEKESFDVIFLDLNLPDDYGISSVRTIKKKCGATKVVVLTGLAGDITYEEAEKAGASYLFVKSHLNPQIIENTL